MIRLRSPVSPLIPDCISHIVTFIDSSATFFRVLSVCSSVYEHFHDYGSVNCEHVNFVLSTHPGDLDSITRPQPFVLKLKISNLLNASQSVNSVLQMFPKLIELWIENPTLEILQQLPRDSLKSLHVVQVPGEFLSILPEFSSLVKVNLFCWRRGRTVTVNLPLNPFEFVRIVGNVRLSLGFLDSSVDSLQHLSLENIVLEESELFMEKLSRLRVLSHLKLETPLKQLISGSVAFPLSLRSLCLNDWIRFEDEEAGHRPFVMDDSLAQSFPPLEELSLHSGLMCEESDPSPFRIVDMKLQNLKKLLIHDIFPVAIYHLDDFSRAPHLGELTVKHSARLQIDFSVGTWARLRKVDFSYNREMGEHTNLMQVLPHLTSLTLRECDSVSLELKEQITTSSEELQGTFPLEEIEFVCNSCSEILSCVKPSSLLMLSLTESFRDLDEHASLKLASLLPFQDQLRILVLTEFELFQPELLSEFSSLVKFSYSCTKLLDGPPIFEPLWFPSSLEQILIPESKFATLELDFNHCVSLKSIFLRAGFASLAAPRLLSIRLCGDGKDVKNLDVLKLESDLPSLKHFVLELDEDDGLEDGYEKRIVSAFTGRRVSFVDKTISPFCEEDGEEEGCDES